MIATLPAEIWSLIIEHLRWDSPSTLKSVNAACHFFHELVLPIFFKCIQVDFPRKGGNGGEFLEFLATADADRTLFQCVKAVVIAGVFPYNQPESVARLLRFLGKCDNLQAFSWRCSEFPKPVRELLYQREYPPRVFMECLGNTCSNPQWDEMIDVSSLFDSLSLFWTDWLNNACPVLKRLILASHSLQGLEMKGFSRALGQPTRFTVSPGDRLPPLKSLRLINCSLGAGQAAAWARSLQCESLEHLAVHGKPYDFALLRDLTGRVTNLKSLEIGFLNDFSLFQVDARIESKHTMLSLCPTVRSFLAEVPQLHEFTAYNFDIAVLKSVAALHGCHLRSLRYRMPSREKTPVERPDPRTHVPVEQLESLAQQLPMLCRLGIDVEIDEPLPYDILSAYARFPSLTYLELNVPFPREDGLSINIPIHPRHPHVTDANVEHIFAFVDGKKQSRNYAALQAVDVKVGLWETLPDNTNRHITHRSIYACRRPAVSPRALRTTFIPRRKPNMFIGDDPYDRALARAGLMDPMVVL